MHPPKLYLSIYFRSDTQDPQTLFCFVMQIPIVLVWLNDAHVANMAPALTQL